MEHIIVAVYNMQGKEVEEMKLDAGLFKDALNPAAIYQAVKAYRAGQRKGLAATKTRGEVSGGGKKPWKQKGTGRARVGSIRSPLWRHGGVVFGPHPRDFSFSLPQKIKRVALKSVVFSKLQDNNLTVLDGISLKEAKTKEASQVMKALKIDNRKQRVLLLLDTRDEKAVRSMRNISNLNITLAREANAYEVLAAGKVIITKLGLTTLIDRIAKC